MYTHSRGFTLIEMMVSIAIIGAVAGVVAYNHGKFNSDLEITNIAYRVALEARQAQVYGISVRQAAGGGTFSAAYGLHFTDAHRTNFIFFTDTDGDGKYTNNSDVDARDFDCGGTECLEQVNIGRGNSIKKICGITSVAPTTCTVLPSLYGLDVMFKRPKTDAVLNSYVSSYGGSPANTCSGSDTGQCAGAAICLQSPQGKEKQVVILSTGQISVENVTTGTSICGT